ncbi:LOW QUALITY PROTEIN: protein JINGUBANG-like [Asparagus officinalis]|uniref:LOW QUALITY PROTEIN: protein JINGUBANG-like n=1 Tax=Asparagus officinalis TaxID=4686 RepID=UPI00098E45C8|nr:LOW QUALITY PROTEIN: protein JINGUBANG-like [Asparagus officinalis]
MRSLNGGAKMISSKLKKSSKFLDLLNSDPNEDDSPRTSTNSDHSNYQTSLENSPYMSPFIKSPWTQIAPLSVDEPSTGLIGSLIREEGHLYSIAVSGELLYTGSDSKNVRVWKNWSEFSGFKSGSGLVKAIILSGNKIFTGHQDGKIRIWKICSKDPSSYKRVGSLPRLKDFIKSSINPSSYVQVRRHRNSVWNRHFDAVSCLSLDEEAGLLYSGSWDKTMKVWRVSDSKCLESVIAHDDAINSVAVGFENLVFRASADGNGQMWRREFNGRLCDVMVKVLLRQTTSAALCGRRWAVRGEEAGVVTCGSFDGLVNFLERGERAFAHGGVLPRENKLAVLCLRRRRRCLVISGSADRSIRVLEEDEGVAPRIGVLLLTGHVGPIKCLAVEKGGDCGPEGRSWVVYSGSLDKSVKVWRVAERGKEPHVTRTDQHVIGEFETRY